MAINRLKATTFRLTLVDIAILDEARRNYGLGSRTEALRFLLRKWEGVTVVLERHIANENCDRVSTRTDDRTTAEIERDEANAEVERLRTELDKTRGALDSKVVFVLCEDTDGTLRSQPWPTGKALDDEDAAKVWVTEATVNYSRNYYRVEVVSDLEGA